MEVDFKKTQSENVFSAKYLKILLKFIFPFLYKRVLGKGNNTNDNLTTEYSQ